jgi:hypothetical protein
MALLRLNTFNRQHRLVESTCEHLSLVVIR